MSGFVYFIRAVDSGRVKIGFTIGNPWDRLDALQTGNHEPLRLHASIQGSPKKERALHERFHHIRERGEWFVPTPELVAYMDGVRDADRNCIHREHLDRVVAEWRGQEAARSAPLPTVHIRAREPELSEEEQQERLAYAREQARKLVEMLTDRKETS